MSGSSLLTGRPRAASLKLVGTELSVRIAPDGQFTLLSASGRTPRDRTNRRRRPACR